MDGAAIDPVTLEKGVRLGMLNATNAASEDTLGRFAKTHNDLQEDFQHLFFLLLLL